MGRLARDRGGGEHLGRPPSFPDVPSLPRRRFSMRRSFFVLIALSLAAAFLMAGPSSSARPGHFTLANRFPPSGTVSVDPLASAKGAAAARKLAAATIPPSISGSGGCPNSSATNVRANQECTNQSATGFVGRGESQNETAVAVN